MSKTKVRVTANPETGEVINISENPKWGFIRVEQHRPVFDDASGFVRVKHMSALVPGSIGDLELLGWVNGQELDGKIIFREQMIPFNKKIPEKNLKLAGETEVVCKINNAPVYRNTFYSPRMDAQDAPLAHDNVEEIRLAYEALEEKSAPAEDLEL